MSYRPEVRARLQAADKGLLAAWLILFLVALPTACAAVLVLTPVFGRWMYTLAEAWWSLDHPLIPLAIVAVLSMALTSYHRSNS